jgi:cell division protein FtsA
MARDKTISGIDIGTSKITTLIASVTDDQELRIIGVASLPSKGLRKGQIVNIEEATSAVSESLEAAERMAGVSVGKTFITVGGNHIASLNSHGVVAVAEPDREISETDVHRVIDAAKAISLPASREILHIIPRGFTVDGQDGIVDPVNMTGVRLEVDTHVITGGSIAIKNLQKCVGELGVDVSGIVFGGLASARAALSDTEQELGAILIDIGGGTTDVAIYVEGALSYSSVIPIGGINITKDLAAGLQVSLESAEKIKIALSQVPKIPVMPSEMDEDRAKKIISSDELDLGSLGIPEHIRTISRKTISEGIIKPRLNEIMSMVALEIKKSGFGGLTPSGVILTGGGALTIGMAESARRNLVMPVHIGMPSHISGLVEEIINPSFAASVGLLIYGLKSDKSDLGGSGFQGFSKTGDRNQMKGLAGKIVDLIKSFLP